MCKNIAGFRAFSSEVDTGSRKENASKQKTRARSDLIRTDEALACLPPSVQEQSREKGREATERREQLFNTKRMLLGTQRSAFALLCQS